MPHDVFISYSKHDKTIADATCAALETQKIRCWIAPRDVVPGTEWGEAIVNAIKGCRIMVLVFSNHANDSKEIHREVLLAAGKGKIIVPFRIEDVSPAKSLDYYLSTTHWLDALTPPVEAHLTKLSSTILQLLGQEENTLVPLPAVKSHFSPLKHTVLLLTIIIPMIAIGLLAWRTYNNTSITIETEANEDLARLSNSTLSAGDLEKLQDEVDHLRAYAIGVPAVGKVELAFKARTSACLVEELSHARALIAPWKQLPEYEGWNQNLSVAETEGPSNWFSAWTGCHSVFTNAQGVLANTAADLAAQALAAISDTAAAETADWCPDKWRAANDFYTQGLIAQKADLPWKARTNFNACVTEADRAIAETRELTSQYETAKANYENIALYLDEAQIKSLLVNQAYDGLIQIQNWGMSAAQQRNPEAITLYSNACGLWPKVVDRAFTNLLQSALDAMNAEEWQSGLQAVTNAIFLAERTGWSERVGAVNQAVLVRNKINSEVMLFASAHNFATNTSPPPVPVIVPAKPSVPLPQIPPPRYQLVGNNQINDTKLNQRWFVADIPQPVSLNEDQDNQVIDQEKARYQARLPTIKELEALATDQKILWVDGDYAYLDRAFVTKLPGGGPWQMTKRCCTDKSGLFFDFAVGHSVRASHSEKGVLILLKTDR